LRSSSSCHDSGPPPSYSFFPYTTLVRSPAPPVGQEVDLVHHHVGEAGQPVRVRVDHVAQDLGGHDDDRRIRIEGDVAGEQPDVRSEEHTSELQSRFDIVCRLLLEKTKKN